MIATIVAAAAVHLASDTTTNGTASRELKRRVRQKQKCRLAWRECALAKRHFFDHEIEKRNCFVLGRPGSDLLSQGLSHSTIGAEEFNGRVRDGIGFKLLARTTRPAKDKETKQAVNMRVYAWTLKTRAIKPIERLVPVSYMRCRTYTPGLSTWSSSTVLKGILVLRWVSRLDAFSGYPVRT